MSTRKEQKERTRARILEAAVAVYANEGLNAPTDRIAKAAQVSHGTLFLHFGQVETLQLAVVEWFDGAVTEKLHRLSESAASLKEALYGHMDVLIAHEGLYRRLVSERALLPDAAMYRFVEIQSMMSFHISKAYEAECAGGAVKKLPIHRVFNVWIGLVHYYLQNADLFAPEGNVLTRYRDELVEAMIAMVERG